MKKSLKVLALVLSVAMVACCFASCGDSKKGSSDTIKIGGIGPITGGAAVYGQAVKNAAEMAVEEINEAGGINGTKIEFNFQDDEHDPEKSVNAYNNLKDWGMQALMGTVTTAPCLAVVEKDPRRQYVPDYSFRFGHRSYQIRQRIPDVLYRS